MTDVGLTKIASLPELHTLGVPYNPDITDAGLATITKCKKLTRISLDYTKVTDAGLDHLAKCKGLTFIDLRKTGVTKAGVEKLALALPNCRIYWDGGVIEPKK